VGWVNFWQSNGNLDEWAKQIFVHKGSHIFMAEGKLPALFRTLDKPLFDPGPDSCDGNVEQVGNLLGGKRLFLVVDVDHVIFLRCLIFMGLVQWKKPK
jgi:hypothetical protein